MRTIAMKSQICVVGPAIGRDIGRWLHGGNAAMTARETSLDRF
jgi:hypothetical protein